MQTVNRVVDCSAVPGRNASLTTSAGLSLQRQTSRNADIDMHACRIGSTPLMRKNQSALRRSSHVAYEYGLGSGRGCMQLSGQKKAYQLWTLRQACTTSLPPLRSYCSQG